MTEAEEPFYAFSNRLSTVTKVVVMVAGIAAGPVGVTGGTAVVTWH
jgi:hypothetical protein